MNSINFSFIPLFILIITIFAVYYSSINHNGEFIVSGKDTGEFRQEDYELVNKYLNETNVTLWLDAITFNGKSNRKDDNAYAAAKHYIKYAQMKKN